MAELSASNGFSSRQRAALAMLCVAPTTSAAALAAAVQISERTARRWLASAEFRAAVDVAVTDVYGKHVQRLKLLTGKALDVLDGALSAETDAPSWATRVRAATAVLAAARDAQLDGIIARLDALELRDEKDAA